MEFWKIICVRNVKRFMTSYVGCKGLICWRVEVMYGCWSI